MMTELKNKSINVTKDRLTEEDKKTHAQKIFNKSGWSLKRGRKVERHTWTPK